MGRCEKKELEHFSRWGREAREVPINEYVEAWEESWHRHQCVLYVSDSIVFLLYGTMLILILRVDPT